MKFQGINPSPGAVLVSFVFFDQTYCETRLIIDFMIKKEMIGNLILLILSPKCPAFSRQVSGNEAMLPFKSGVPLTREMA